MLGATAMLVLNLATCGDKEENSTEKVEVEVEAETETKDTSVEENAETNDYIFRGRLCSTL